MKTVHKYPIVPNGMPYEGPTVHVTMPAFAEVLHVGVQGDDAFLWALVDTHKPMQVHSFEVYGTGHEVICDPPFVLHHLGTIHLPTGLVFHIFSKDAGDLGDEE